MSDKFTETSYTSPLGRIMESIKGVIVGLLFCAIAPIGIYLNEKNAVDTAAALSEMEKIVATVPSDAKDLGADLKLICTKGKATPAGELADDVFPTVKATAIKLERHAKMYQWNEHTHTKKKDNVGGGQTTETTYEYKQEWEEHWIDSTKFHKNPGGKYDNPPMPFESKEFVADSVTVGTFTLNKELIHSISAGKQLSITDAMFKDFPADMQAKFKLSAGKLSSGTGSQVGDMRVEFEVVEAQTVSFVAGTKGGTTQPWKASNGKEIQFLYCGDLDATTMFAKQQSENTQMLWIFRVVLFFVMWIGLSLIVGPISAVFKAIPGLGWLLGDFVEAGVGFVTFLLAAFVTLVVTAIAWIACRPVMGIGMMVAALALFFVARSMGGKKKV